MTIRVNQSEIPGTVLEAKRWWRREIRRQLAMSKDGYRNVASERIRRALCHMDEYKKAGTVLVYFSAGKEVLTQTLMTTVLRHGKKVCLPLCMDMDANGRILEADHRMEAREWGTGYKLVPGAYGIPTPDPKAPEVRPEDIDLVILPCVSCDEQCNRLGHGAGYYDRFISQLRDGCTTIAVCYEDYLAEKLPVEAHDKPVDAVITEERVIRSAAQQ